MISLKIYLYKHSGITSLHVSDGIKLREITITENGLALDNSVDLFNRWLNNTRYNVRVIYQGVDLTISQWSRELNINNSTLRSRLKRFNSDMGAILDTYKDMKDSYEDYINRERR